MQTEDGAPKRQKLSDSIEKIVIDVIDTLGESLNYTRNLMAELSLA